MAVRGHRWISNTPVIRINHLAPKDVEIFYFEVATGDDPLGYLVWIVDRNGDQAQIILDTDGVVVESGAGEYTLPDDVLRG